MNQWHKSSSHSGWRLRLHEIIFEADTPAGKAFDIALIWSILLSVAVIMLESVSTIRAAYGIQLYLAEWFFTILFTIEYILRLISVGRPLRYATSFFGIVDLLAVIPTYMGLLIPATHYLAVVRILRVLRIFRILKLAYFLGEAEFLVEAVRGSSRKIVVFLFFLLTIIVICGALMYVIEGEDNGFTSIPKSIYWAIVTLTTVGYGDISPKTNLGQFLSSFIMIMGYGIIAVPTGIFTISIAETFRQKVSTQACPECSAEGHAADALYCKKCGAKL